MRLLAAPSAPGPWSALLGLLLKSARLGFFLLLRADIGGGVAERDQVVLHHRTGALLQRVQVAEGFVFRDSPAPCSPRRLALIGRITSVRLSLRAHTS